LRSSAICEHRQPKQGGERIAACATKPIIAAETGRQRGDPVRRGDHETKAERKWLLAISFDYLSMIFSDLASPAEAPSERINGHHGFAQAGSRYPPRITSGAGFFGIML
jgi:hypothetical protein